MMTIREAVKWGAKRLRDNNVDNADHDSFELLSAINGMTRTFYLVNGDSMLSEENFLLYEEYIDKRAAHVPLQHILGKAYFYGYEFEVNEDVLIPRPDTEVLVGEVIKVTRNGDNILDMCTGSGCIGITLAKKFPESRVLGVDVSERTRLMWTVQPVISQSRRSMWQRKTQGLTACLLILREAICSSMSMRCMM